MKTIKKKFTYNMNDLALIFKQVKEFVNKKDHKDAIIMSDFKFSIGGLIKLLCYTNEIWQQYPSKFQRNSQ